MAKTLAYGMMALVLLAGTCGAYSCMFSASTLYPAQNKAYCSSGSVKCYYPYTYLQSNCLRVCCQKVSPGFETSAEDSTDPDAGYDQYETLDSTYDSYYQGEVAKGNALKIGFNTYCLYSDGLAIGSGDAKKIDDCAVECAKGYATSFGNPNAATKQERYDSIPPSLRQCVCDMQKDWLGSSLCDSVGTSSQTTTTTPTTAGPCDGVTCPKKCVTSGGVATLYYDGTCVPKGQTGYSCSYSQKECDWGCESDGSGCVTAAPADVTIQSPSDGASIDTAAAGYANINVTGFVSGGSNAGVTSVLVGVGLTGLQAAKYESATGKFTYANIPIYQGKPARITAVAMKGSTRMGSDEVVVYPAPVLESVAIRCQGPVVMFRNSAVVPCGTSGGSAQDGDEIQLTGDGAVWFKYTDGTTVVLKSPARVRFWKKAVYVDYGGVEVQVNHDYEVLTKQGHYVARGTQFRVEVPQDTAKPETLTVLSGSVDAALAGAADRKVTVDAGEKLALVPGTAPASGDVKPASSSEMVKFVWATSDPFGVGAGESADAGCCGSAFVLLAIGTGMAFTARKE